MTGRNVLLILIPCLVVAGVFGQVISVLKKQEQ